MRSNLGDLNRRWLMAAMIITAAVIFSLVATPMEGAHPESSLAGSNFEIDSDANLIVDHVAPSIDWAMVLANAPQTKQEDKPSGSGDDAFGKGTKEDTAVPAPVTGSIPPNKSDLSAFGVYLEQNNNGKFMHLFWTRVQDPKGTTNMVTVQT